MSAYMCIGRGGLAQCVLFEKDVYRPAEHVTARIAIAVRSDGRVVKAQHMVLRVVE
jgi:hypothetical protein